MPLSLRALVLSGPPGHRLPPPCGPQCVLGVPGANSALVRAPAHGARKRPLVAAPHHHVRLVVVLLVEHDVARAEGGVGDVGGAFLDAPALRTAAQAPRAPPRAWPQRPPCARSCRTARRRASGTWAASGTRGSRLPPGPPRPSSPGTSCPWHVRPLRAPLALALGAHVPLAAVLAAVRLVDSLCRLVALDALAANLATKITPRNPFFSSHARRSASVLGLRPMASYQFQWGHKSKGLVCRFGNAQVARFGAHSSARFLPLAAALMASSLATAAFFLSATSS